MRCSVYEGFLRYRSLRKESSAHLPPMLLLDHTPRLSPGEAASLTEKVYGLAVTATPLPSERDQNFLLENEAKEKFVLKIANALEERALLEAQNEALAHIARELSFCPRVIPTIAGAEIAQISAPAGMHNFVRLLNYLPGTPLAKIEFHSSQILRDLGRRLAQ